MISKLTDNTNVKDILLFYFMLFDSMSIQKMLMLAIIYSLEEDAASASLSDEKQHNNDFM